MGTYADQILALEMYFLFWHLDFSNFVRLPYLATLPTSRACDYYYYIVVIFGGNGVSPVPPSSSGRVVGTDDFWSSSQDDNKFKSLKSS